MGNYDSGRATDLGGLNVEQRRADSLAGVRFEDSRAEPTSSNDLILYRNGTSLFWWNGTSAVNMSSGAGGGGGDTLDSAYDNGRTVQVSGGAVVLAGVDEDTAVLSLTGDGDSSGALITFAHTTASRNDLLGTSSTWKITGQGAITATALVLADNELITMGDGSDATIGWNGAALNIAGVVDFDDNVTLAASATIVQAGVAGSTVFTITAGDAVMSDGSLAITDADNAETVTIINNTATTIGAAASGGVLQVESTGLTTGVLINAQATEGTLNGGFYFGAWDATAGARVFGVGENGVLTVTGAGGAAALTITAGDVVFSDGSVAITDADNAAALVIVNNTVTTANQIVSVASTSITTGAMMTLDANTVTHDGEILELISAGDATSTPTGISVVIATPTSGAAVGLDITMAGATTGPKGIRVTMDAITESDMLYLDNGGDSLTSGFFINCNDDDTGLFTVGAKGATVIAGAAAGTDALTLTAGDLTMTAGHLVMTLGNATMTAGNLLLSDGSITATSAVDEAVLTVTGNVTAASQSVASIIQDHATGATAVLTVQQDDVSEEFIAFNSTAASGAAVDLTNTTPAAVTGSVIVSAVDGTKYRVALYAAAGWS